MQMSYDLKTIEAPPMKGSRLLVLTWLLEHAVGKAIAPVFLSKLGIERFRSRHYDEALTWYPSPVSAKATDTAVETAHHPLPDEGLLKKLGTTRQPEKGWDFPSVGDYARGYRDGSANPVEVADRIISVLEQQNRGNPPLYGFTAWHAEEIRQQAEESVRRIADGSARSVLEGVPVAVKDEIDVAGYPTSLGTRFLADTNAGEDAWIVARLREAGALIIGKTNMHEVGLGVTGLNPVHGTPVNPYAPWRYPGGSSSGSASVVASGICPAALACDGGGSVRIPAAYCGVFGLKLTMGRVSSRGEFPLAPTVGNAGPIAGNARDLALMYLTIAGADPDDPLTHRQPPPNIDGFLDDVRGLKIGIYRPWFEDACPEVVETATALVDRLRDEGAGIVEIDIPELDSLRVAHLITITTEMQAALSRFSREHKTHFSSETRLNIALSRYLNSEDYIKAQQIRTRLLKHFLFAFETVDLIVTPTTANLPPRLHGSRVLSGVSDLASLTQTMRYAVPANMLGFPAVSVPAGFVTTDSRRFMPGGEETDKDGKIYSRVPVGVQFIGRHWEEALLLRMARMCEELVVRPRPRVWFSPFEGQAKPFNE
jgi:Asp-tRNA(Asn)/Glu-tRNA(Gln) amidotransferase A subunit family amidase